VHYRVRKEDPIVSVFVSERQRHQDQLRSSDSLRDHRSSSGQMFRHPRTQIRRKDVITLSPIGTLEVNENLK